MSPTASALLLRVGLAGVGRFGQLHASVLADLPGVELAALADADPLRLAPLADRHGVVARYGNALELIADDTLDAVVLAPLRHLSWRNGWPPLGRMPGTCSGWRPKPA
jgi:hypothetical protein